MPIGKLFGSVATTVARAAGKPVTFILAVLSVLVWIASGPVFGFSDTWQLIINTSTTIVTFLMVFLLQNSQNRDNIAIQIKLDELIRVSKVQNRFIGIENLTEEEVEEIREKCEGRARGKEDRRKEAIKDTAQAGRRKAKHAAHRA